MPPLEMATHTEVTSRQLQIATSEVAVVLRLGIFCSKQLINTHWTWWQICTVQAYRAEGHEIENHPSQIKDVQNVYSPLPSLALSVNTIGQ